MHAIGSKLAVGRGAARLTLLPRRPVATPAQRHRARHVCARAAQAGGAPEDGDAAYAGSARASGDDTDDSGGETAAGAHAYSPNIFEALPPPPNVGRKRQVAALALGAMIEFSVTGAIMWAPLLAALAVIALAPSRRQLQEREAEVAAIAAERARIEMVNRMPVTPVEAAQWINRLNQEMWAPFIEPLLLRQCLAQWQDAIANAAPRGWTLAIADVSMGSDACSLSEFQAYGDPTSGRLTAIDCKLSLNSDTMKVVVRGSSPIAAFTATVSGIRMAGDLRITPLLDQRMLLWGFKKAPKVNVKLAVKGPIGGADLTQFQFIQGIVAQTIEELLVEPNRGALPLDYDLRVEEAVATTVNLHIEALLGLPRTLGRRRAPTKLGVVAVETVSRQQAATVREITISPGSRQALVRETIKVELPRKEGVFRIELRDLSAGGRKLGDALLWVAATMDGSTLFWGHDRAGEALARRWAPSDRPWRVSLPLEGEAVGRMAEVRLGVGVEPWTYKQPLAPTSYRSTGPHTVVLQVVEARYLGGPQPTAIPAASNNPFIQLQYDQATYGTAVAYGTTSPVFLETFAFAENASMLTRRVRLEAWSAPPAVAARGGGGTPGASFLSTDGGGERREYYGGTAVNLDLTTEGAVQDRWYALGGGEGGEARVRLAVVAGRPEEEGTQEVLDFCCSQLASTSRATLLVEVLSARLQLPLSSIDSDDTDSQPVYRITYHGTTFISDPVPPGRRRRSRTGRLGLRRRAQEPGAPPAPSPAGGSPARAGSPAGGQPAAAPKASPTDDILARATFPYAPDASSAATGPSPAVGSSAAAPPSYGALGAAPTSRRARRWIDYALLIECCDVEAGPGDEVMGAVEVDAAQRLALSGGNAWEGWLKLNKDGGQVLVRMTLLPASEPADIFLPQPKGVEPAASALVTLDTPTALAPAAAAAAVPAGSAAGGAAPGAAVNAMMGALEVDGAWIGQLVGRAQEAQEGLRDRVEEQAQQAAAAVNGWMQQAAGWFGGPRAPQDGGAKGGEAPQQAPGQEQGQQQQKQQKQQKQQQPAAKGSEPQAPAAVAAAAKGPFHLPGLGNGVGGAGKKPAAVGGGAAAAPAGEATGKPRSGSATPRGGGSGGGGAGGGVAGFDVQKALMSALGGLGWDAARRPAAARPGGAGKEPSGWWDKVDKSPAPQPPPQQQQEQEQEQEQQHAADAPAEHTNGGAEQPPSGARSPGAAGAPGGVALAGDGGDDAARLRSAVRAAAAAHAREATRRAAVGGLSSYPLADTISSFPVDTSVSSHPVTDIDTDHESTQQQQQQPDQAPGGAAAAGAQDAP